MNENVPEYVYSMHARPFMFFRRLFACTLFESPCCPADPLATSGPAPEKYFSTSEKFGQQCLVVLISSSVDISISLPSLVTCRYLHLRFLLVHWILSWVLWIVYEVTSALLRCKCCNKNSQVIKHSLLNIYAVKMQNNSKYSAMHCDLFSLIMKFRPTRDDLSNLSLRSLSFQ